MNRNLGADPEFFITDRKGNFISIIGKIGGTKENPKIIDDFGQFKIQEDNVAAEYNIPPTNTKEKFIQHILWPQEYITKLLGTDKFKISHAASASFPTKELKHPKALEFGCDPDYNAWSLTMNEKPECEDKTFRTCGGHVHFECAQEPEEIIRIIRNMDKVLGVWSVIIDPDKERRALYGSAGSFRPQPHGGEYRTLSNFWIFDPILISEVFDRAQYAFTLDIPSEEEGNKIQQIINYGDINAAKQYLQINGL